MKVILISLVVITSLAALYISVPIFVGHSVFAQNTTKAIGASIPYYLFPTEIEGVEEELLKIPHDAFTLQTIVANKGDNLTIKFYNTEATEAHTFTLDTPYNINKELIGGQNSTINFVADKEGIFTYYCVYHLPTMTGKLVVLP
jgi:plastocyanin